MQETKGMDLKELIKDQPASGDDVTAAKKEILTNATTDSATALQLFLDRIPVRSIPGIKNDSSVLELKTGVVVKDAIEQLYEKNVSVAPIADVLDPESTIGRSSDRYIGFIDFASMILWSLENCEAADSQPERRSIFGEKEESCGTSLLSMVEQNPQTGQTKLAELAKSFLWKPFFPVNLDDTLLHVMLLLAAHRLHFVPVKGRPDSHITGFVTQNAVIELLLQSDGLEWFDNIATKTLSDFRFDNAEHVDHVYGDESIEQALRILSKSQVGAIAVFDKGTQKLIGCFGRNDVHLLMDNNLFDNRKNLTMEKFVNRRNLTMEKFIQTESTISATDGEMRKLNLINNLSTRMDSPVTNKKSDTLKEAMENLTRNRSDYSFLVDDTGNAIGVITVRDVITQFAPPSMNSSIHGVGFFDSALEQVGCQVKNQTVVYER